MTLAHLLTADLHHGFELLAAYELAALGLALIVLSVTAWSTQ